MMTDREIRRLLRRNLKAHGAAVELVKLVEECCELGQAAAKLLTCGEITEFMIGRLAEEMADVEICMEQARMALIDLREREDEWIDAKLRRMEAGLRG